MQSDLILRLPKVRQAKAEDQSEDRPGEKAVFKSCRHSLVLPRSSHLESARHLIFIGDKVLGMKRAVVVFYFSMISLGVFFFILCGVLGSVVWAGAENQNEI
jgi:hypothetical protein